MWRHTTTRKGSLSICRGRPPGCTTFACTYRRACAPTGRRQAHKQGCIVQCAQPREARACIQDAICADASGKEQRQEAGDRDRRSKSFGARAARRCCREERKAACRRHGEPAQARPRPHRLEGGAARRAREERGVALSIAAINIASGLALAAEWIGWRGCRIDWMAFSIAHE